MMTVSEVVSQLLGSDRVAEMAERVAVRSRMGVWQRVMHRLTSLGPTEARGYLRARGITVVREETLRLIEQEGAVASDWRPSENNRRARFYRLTRAGHKLLKTEKLNWEQTAAIIAHFFEVEVEDLA